MSVYVDPIFRWIDGNHYSHMIADSEDELWQMAKRLGLRKKWLHVSSSGIRHYDLSRVKRWRAVEYGAIELSAKDWLQKAKQNMNEPDNQEREAV